jgi:4,5-DOPA dioxygenase extradiol
MKRLTRTIPMHEAVLAVSAYLANKGNQDYCSTQPKRLFMISADLRKSCLIFCPPNPTLALKTSRLIKNTNVGLDYDWRLDHGIWMVVKHTYQI